MSLGAAPVPVTRGRTGVLLVNLGTPDAPTPAALRRYLHEFLSDPRVVEIPRFVWWPLLNGVILLVRPAKSAAKYRSIWLDEGSPLAVWTIRQTHAVAAALAARGHDVGVRHAMRYGSPSIAATLDEMRAAGAARVLVVPMYPQYASATTGSVADALADWTRGSRVVPEMRTVGAHHDDPGYIAALAARLARHWSMHPRAERLVLSFHGLPERTRALGDPYYDQCLRTAELLRQQLQLSTDQVVVTFQSRFGKAQWLQPYTEPTLCELAAQGIRSVDVMCPGFVADCLETLEEVAMECRSAFTAAGGSDFRYVPCLNDDPAWIGALTALVERHLQGWDTAGGG